jgi:hypothetical protein
MALKHYEVHFERMLAGKRPRIDKDAASPGEPGVGDGCDRRFAERRPPFGRRVNGEPTKGDPVGGADDDDAPRRIGVARPRAERGRGDRAGIDDASMRGDHDFRRAAAAWARPLAHVRDQGLQRFRLSRVEHPRDLRRMNFGSRHGDAPSISC